MFIFRVVIRIKDVFNGDDDDNVEVLKKGGGVKLIN